MKQADKNMKGENAPLKHNLQVSPPLLSTITADTKYFCKNFARG